jgi:hypothetical protein
MYVLPVASALRPLFAPSLLSLGHLSGRSNLELLIALLCDFQALAEHVAFMRHGAYTRGDFDKSPSLRRTS